jgi:hypothetical protein
MDAAEVSLWLPFCHLKHVSSEPLKSPLATGKYDNLLVPMTSCLASRKRPGKSPAKLPKRFPR